MTKSPGSTNIFAVMNTAMLVRDVLATTLVFHYESKRCNRTSLADVCPSGIIVSPCGLDQPGAS